MADTMKNASPPPAFTREELVIINNALNEVCNGVSMSDEEFETRLGCPRATARKVLAKVAKSLEK
jgi:hypothetical protein